MSMEGKGQTVTNNTEPTNNTNNDKNKTGYNQTTKKPSNIRPKITSLLPTWRTTGCKISLSQNAPGSLAKAFIRERAKIRKACQEQVCPAGRLIYDRTEPKYLSHMNDLFEDDEDYGSDDSSDSPTEDPQLTKDPQPAQEQ